MALTWPPRAAASYNFEALASSLITPRPSSYASPSLYCTRATCLPSVRVTSSRSRRFTFSECDALNGARQAGQAPQPRSLRARSASAAQALRASWGLHSPAFFHVFSGRWRGYKDAGSLTAEERAAGRAHAARHAAREVLEVVGAREADETAVRGARVWMRVLVQWCCLGRRLRRVWRVSDSGSSNNCRVCYGWRSMDARSASQRFRRRHRRKHDDAKSSNAGMRAQIARGLPLAKWTSGPTQFKIKTLLSRLATYPSGALRRAGASGDRAIVTAVRDGPPRSQTILRRRQRRIAQEPCP